MPAKQRVRYTHEKGSLPAKVLILQCFEEFTERETRTIIKAVQRKSSFSANTISRELSKLKNAGVLVNIRRGLWGTTLPGTSNVDPGPGLTEDIFTSFFVGENPRVHRLRYWAKQIAPKAFLTVLQDPNWKHNKEGSYCERLDSQGDKRLSRIQFFKNGTVDIHLEARNNPIDFLAFVEFESWLKGVLSCYGIKSANVPLRFWHCNEDFPKFVLHGAPIKAKVFREVWLQIYQHKELGMRRELIKQGKTPAKDSQFLRQWLSAGDSLGTITQTRKDLYLGNIVAKTNSHLTDLQKHFKSINSNMAAGLSSFNRSIEVVGKQLIAQGQALTNLTSKLTDLLSSAESGVDNTGSLYR